MLQEAERIRIENADLKKRLSDLEVQEVTFPTDLLGPTDELELIVTITYRDRAHETTRTEVQKVKVTLGYVFLSIFDSLLAEPSEYRLRSIIARALPDLILAPSEKNAELQIDQEQVVRLRFHLEALGLIQAIGGVSSSDLGHRIMRSEYIAWTITDKGRRFVTQHRAIRRVQQA